MTSPAILQLTISKDGTKNYEEYETSEIVPPENQRVWYRLFPRGYKTELKALTLMSIPVIITQATQYFMLPVALMFCGRLGTINLDAASMAITFINCMGVTIAIGMATACDTLFSQIYGSSNRKKLGVVFVRSIMIIPLCSLPPIALFVNGEAILLGLGQAPEVARQAGKILVIFIPGLLAFFFHIPMTKYLQCQNIIIPPMIIGLISNGINIALHFLLVFHLDYGIIGSAISLAVTYTTLPIMTLIYIIVFKVYKDTWAGWSSESFLDWSQFFTLSWFGLAMIAIEWWSYEVGLIMAGVLGTTELGCQSVIFNIFTYGFIFSMGIAVSVNIRIGHFLGANDPLGAVNCYRVAISVTWIISLIFSCLYCGLRNYIPYIVTNIPEVVEMTADVLPLISIVPVLEGTFVVCGGVLRGSGRQNIASVVILVSYAIGLSIAIPLMLKTGTIKGFWEGMIVGIGCEAIVLLAMCIWTNWPNQVQKALERVRIATTHTTGPSINKYGGESGKQPLLKGEENGYHTYESLQCDNGDRSVPQKVYIRTVIVVLVLLMTVLAGVLCRIYIPIVNKIEEVIQPNATYIPMEDIPYTIEPWIS